MKQKQPVTYLSVHTGLNRDQKRRALRYILHQMKNPPITPKEPRPTRASRRARAKKQANDAGPTPRGE